MPIDPRPVRGFVFFLMLAAVGPGAALMSAALLTLTLKATEVSESAAATISLSSGIAGIFTLLALPITGALSDRSRSRFGRRRPFLIAGALFFALGGALLVVAPNVALFIVAHLTITTGFVLAGVTVTALVADQLPVDRRAAATAFLSIGTPVGALVGTAAALPFGDDLLPLVGLPTVFAVVTLLMLAAVIRDPRIEDVHTGERGGSVLRVFWVDPIAHPGFAAVFASRLLVFAGVAALNGYQAIFLLENMRLDAHALAPAILLTVLINVSVTVVAAPIVGRVSDRMGVRKPFIVVAAITLAMGLVFAAMAPDLSSYLIACGVVGLGQGVYFAVELALATQVLPDPKNPAKDLGILRIADNLPVTLVAAVAPALLAVGAASDGEHNFSALFLAGAASALMGGFVILLVRTAR